MKNEKMELHKFYETRYCQCFKIEKPSKKIQKIFNKNKFLFIFYDEFDCVYDFGNDISKIFMKHFDFFFMFTFGSISIERILPKLKDKSHREFYIENSTPTNKYFELLNDNLFYIIPLAKFNKKVSFQILDSQLLRISSDVKSIAKIISKYNEINKFKPIKISTILKELMSGRGIDENMNMIRFRDRYNENIYQPIMKNEIVFGYNFRSSSIQDEVRKINSIEGLFESFDQEIELFPTVNHSLENLSKIKGAKKTKSGSILIKYSDLLKSGIKWKITDFLS